jgi:phage terminase large subunit GpA-like protein
MVPPWVRFLIATIDVQADAFVVRITGFGPGNDMTLIDTFKIRKSNRLDPHDLRGTQYAKLDPASYPEDWDLIVEQVIESSYPLADGSGRRMAIKATGCDSGGKDGVTTNAYTFWRKLRDDSEGRGYHRRFHLVKGTTTRDAPRRKTSYPDSNRRDRNAGARGDVPVQLFNSNLLKDQLNALLGRAEPGGGMMRFPAWTPIWVFKQLTAEDRGPKGWVNPSNRRNEDWDLSYYALGLCLHPDINLERITWNDGEPAWAKPWDENIFVFAPEEPGPIRVDGGPPINLRRIADGFL